MGGFIASTTNPIVVKRGTTTLVSGSTYVPGETLTISPTSGAGYCMEVLGGTLAGGSCSNTRLCAGSGTAGGTWTLPASGAVTVNFVWTSGCTGSGLKVETPFTLTAAPAPTPVPTPVPTTTAAPTTAAPTTAAPTTAAPTTAAPTAAAPTTAAPTTAAPTNQKCVAGTWSADGSTECTDCVAGTWSAAGATECIVCGAGKYSSVAVLVQEYITYNGNDYAVIDFTDPDEQSMNCQQNYLPLPSGWQHAAASADTEHAAISYYWGTHVVTTESRGYNTKGCPHCSPMGQVTITNNNGEYRPNTCHDRVFISRTAQVVEPLNVSESICVDCIAGKWAAPGAAACTDCAAGKYSTVTAATSSSTCTDCAAGSSSAAGVAECTACTPGKYATSAGDICTKCPAGKSSAATSATECTDCAAGTWSISGAAACFDCAAGFFSAVTGAKYCTACDPGKYTTDTGAASESICVACAAGKYSSTTSPSCVWVPNNINTSGEKSLGRVSSRNECVYRTMTECPTASIANVSSRVDEDGSGSCWCQWGDNMTPQEGSSYTNCLLTTMSDTYMQFIYRKFSPENREPVFITYNGNDYAVIDFTDPDEQSMNCQQNYLPLPSGWQHAAASADTEHAAISYYWGTHVVTTESRGYNTKGCPHCSPMGQVTITNNNGEYRPNTCHDRVFISRTTTATARRKLVASESGGTVCADCPAGTWSGSGAVNCNDCSIGTFSAEIAATGCFPCAAGYSTMTMSSGHSEACVACPQGKISLGTGGPCIPPGIKCMQGCIDTECASNDDPCCILKCATDFHEKCISLTDQYSIQIYMAQSGCAPFPDRSNTDNSGNTGNNDGTRLECGAGKYVQNKNSAQESCAACPRGKFSNLAKRNRTCKKCPNKYYTPNEGSDKCVRCPAGFGTKGQRGKHQCFHKQTYQSMKQLGHLVADANGDWSIRPETR